MVDGNHGDVNAARTTPPTDSEVKQWLVGHYSHAEKMRRDRIDLLVEEKPNYAFLREPNAPKLYRGLHNVTKQTLAKLKGKDSTDATKDKSWTTSKAMAWKFARGEFSSEESIDGRYAVVLSAAMPSKRAILTASLAAKEPGIGDHWNELWDEPLGDAIKAEKEVLVSGSVDVSGVDSEELKSETKASMSTNAFMDDDWYDDGTAAYVKDGTLYIPIMDVISRYWVSAKSIKKALSKHSEAERIVLQVNSPGGDVQEGTTIFGTLRADGRPIEAHVYGVAASMASVIMLAADRRVMLPGSMVMVHEPWSFAMGDAAFFEKEAVLLNDIASSMLGIYSEHTGGAEDKLREAMKAETWLTAEDAVDWGFAHEVVDGRDLAPQPSEMSASADWNLRRGVILSCFENTPETVSEGGRLGWSGATRDEIKAALKAIPRAASIEDAMTGVLKMVGAGKATEPPKPSRPKVPAKATAESEPPYLGALKIEVSVAQPPAQQAVPTPTEAKPLPREATSTRGNDETKQMEFLSQLAVSLGLPPDASPELIQKTAEANKAALATATDKSEKAEAEAAAAKALADERERERLASEATAALERETAAAQAAIERKLYERQAFDAKVNVLTKGLTPAFSEAMQKLCYREDEGHPSGKVPREAGYEAAAEAIKQVPQSQKDAYSGANADLEAALEANPENETRTAGGVSINDVFAGLPGFTSEGFAKHEKDLRARKARIKTTNVVFTA